MAISIGFKDKYVYFGPEAGLHTQGEARAEVYDVTGPRYHDGHDLSAMTWYVRASHPDYMTIINKQLRVSVDPDNEGQIIITWPVDADFTAYSGQLDVQFVAWSSTGEEIIKLQSNGLQFAASVEGTAAPPKNVFENTLEQMQGLLDNAENAAAQSAADASRAEDAQEAAAQSAQQAQQAQQAVAGDVEQAAVLVEQIEGDAEAAAASAAAAKTSETNAAASKTAAANSASAAATSETNAASSESAAAASASAAKTSETNAAASKTAAANSASAAKTSETNAAASKTAAEGSASSAAQSEAAAEAAAQRAEDAAEKIDMSNYLLKTGDGKDVTVAFSPSSAADFSAPVSGSKLSAVMVMLSKWRNYISRALVPTGTVLAFAGSSAPSGFLLCDGRAVSRTTYTSLFSVIGTTYGSGDGSTTFNLPDMRGRVAVGSDANSPGVKVGTKGAAIQDYNLPGNTIIGPVKIDSGWGFGHWQSWADADNIATTTSNAEKAFTNLGIMQPSLYLNYVVKV